MRTIFTDQQGNKWEQVDTIKVYNQETGLLVIRLAVIKEA